MSDGTDIQRLEARIAALESRLGGGSQFSAPGGGGGAGGAATPAEWIAGAIAASLPQGSPTGMGQTGQPQQAQQVGAQAFTGSSTCWCESRFICATMNCGGSGWC